MGRFSWFYGYPLVLTEHGIAKGSGSDHNLAYEIRSGKISKISQPFQGWLKRHEERLISLYSACHTKDIQALNTGPLSNEKQALNTQQRSKIIKISTPFHGWLRMYGGSLTACILLVTVVAYKL